jgi:DNA polymerase III alpha subunit (gram-positive type)
LDDRNLKKNHFCSRRLVVLLNDTQPNAYEQNAAVKNSAQQNAVKISAQQNATQLVAVWQIAALINSAKQNDAQCVAILQ